MPVKRNKSVVVTAFAEPASGPGWSNQPIWVILRDPDQKLRVECIQPDKQTLEMRILYGASASVHSAMLKQAIKSIESEEG